MPWIFTWLLVFLIGNCIREAEAVGAECGPTEFTCANGKCINIAWKCDDDDDCRDNSDEKDCPSTTCADSFYRCDNGNCIPVRWVCDGSTECQDGSDEKPELCQNQTCSGYRCKESGMCIPSEWKCDSQSDCPKGDDEAECDSVCDPATEFMCGDNSCISIRWKCDHHEDCVDGSDEIKCSKTDCDATGEKVCDDGECINELWWCDGDDDCKDKSDEMNCTHKLAGETCGSTEFHCLLPLLDPQCIHTGWLCDGDEDCSDGSDEIGCDARTCSLDEKMCKSHYCIKARFICDGEIDCGDGDDEDNCTDTVVDPHRLLCLHEFNCGNKCISYDKICNGHDDCGNGADEGPDLHCSLGTPNACEHNNGDCDHLCIPNTSAEGGRKCECHTGFTFSPGSNTECVDIDECKTPGICSQICTNTKGSYKCECFIGYTLKNHQHCKATDGSHPELILSDRHELRRYQLDTFHYSVLLDHEVSGAVAMDFDIRNNTIFWTDVQSEKVFSANLKTHEVNVIIESNLGMPDGLAVDWVNGNIYLSDTGLDRIEVARLNGSSRKILVDEKLDEPRALVLDPNSGWMYWTDWGSKPKIEKCGMNGQHRQELVTSNLAWPNGLAIDYLQNRLYWVDAKMHIIGSCDLEGKNFKQILKTHRNLGHPFAITIFEDYLYWTDWMSNAVHRVSKFGHDNVSTIALDLKTPMDIHVYHIYRQPSLMKRCGENNGGCSHLCLPIPDSKTFSVPLRSECACPDNMILDDKFNCKLSDKTAPTKKPLEMITDVTSANRAQTRRPVQTTPRPEENTDVKVSTPKVEQTTHGEFINKTHIETLQHDESVGFVAVIVIAIIIIAGLTIFVIIFLLLKRHKSKNVKTMSFKNPVYRKSNPDDELIMDKSGSRSSISQSLQPLTQDNELV